MFGLNRSSKIPIWKKKFKISLLTWKNKLLHEIILFVPIRCWINLFDGLRAQNPKITSYGPTWARFAQLIKVKLAQKLNFLVSINNYIFKNSLHQDRSCGAKELNNPGPLYSKPKAYAEEEEMPEDEQRKSKLPRDIAKDNPVLG